MKERPVAAGLFVLSQEILRRTHFIRRCIMRAKLVKGLLTVLLGLGLLLPGCSTFPQLPAFSAFPLFSPDSADRAQTLANDIHVLKQVADEDGRVAVVIKLQGASLLGIEDKHVVPELKKQATQSQRGMLEFLTKNGATVLNTFWLTNAILAEVPVGLLDEFVTVLQVERLYENFTVDIPEPLEEGDVSVLGTSYTWGLEKIGAPDVWDMGITGAGVRAAVLDTGVDIGHPDLAGKMWTEDHADPAYPGGWIEFDVAGEVVVGSLPRDTDSHGTHCSGTVLGGDTAGIAIGVAPGARLMHALVIPEGRGTYAQIIAGMQWTMDPFDQYGNPAGEPADVVSMSLGVSGYRRAFVEPVQNMKAAGVVLIAAIGNGGEGASSCPGNVYDALGIGATHYEDVVASFSSGEVVDWQASHPVPYIKPDFSAPGVNVYSSVPGGYAWLSGTSMAAPHLAGTVALMLEANPASTVAQVYDALKDTALDLGTPGQDIRYGWGRVDAFEAVSLITPQSGIEGFVIDADSGEPLSGVKASIPETGQTRYTDASGYYRAFLPPGVYGLNTTAFGYYEHNASVVVVEDAFTSQNFTLERMPAGLIAGNITDAGTGQPIEGATITVLDTPLETATDATGGYALMAPVGTYHVRAGTWGYYPSVVFDVNVVEGETSTVDFALEETQMVAVLGDYGSQLTDLLLDNRIWAEQRSWSVIADIGRYDAVVVGCPSDPGGSTFLQFLEAASDNQVRVVFTSSWDVWQPYGISLLEWYLGDPVGQEYDFYSGNVYYKLEHPNPLFEGQGVGSSIDIITGGEYDHAWFLDYTGYVIAHIGSQYGGVQGDAVALGAYGRSEHVLLAGLAPQSFTNVVHWTEEAKTIFAAAVSSSSIFSGVEGVVTDAETGEPLEGTLITVPQTGQTKRTDGSGYYRLVLPPGTHSLTAGPTFGCYEQSAMVEVVQGSYTLQDFALEPKPTGFIAGMVTDTEMEPIQGAIVALPGTPLSTNTSETGQYSIEAPIGTYDIRAQARHHRPTVSSVTVLEGETVVADFALEPGLMVAVLGDYDSQLTDLLLSNDIWAEERNWDVVSDTGNYDVVVVNRPSDPGPSTFLELLDRAGDAQVRVVFTSSWQVSEPYGISLLEWYVGDPVGQSHDYWSGVVYYRVKNTHPMLGDWEVGDEVTIITGGYYDHAWFWGYSGLVIGEVGSHDSGIRGAAMAVGTYYGSEHVLLAGLAPQSSTNVVHWTDEAKTIFMSAVTGSMPVYETLYTLTISSRGAGSVTDPGEGRFTYPAGTVVDLLASPDPGDAYFIKWTGDVSTIADITASSTSITMNDNYSIRASFGGPGCFIATAAYDTPMAEEIQILRDFRDEYLLTNPLGQAFVDSYYRSSPPIAGFINEHPNLKPLVRAGLVPAIAMSTIVVNTSPVEKAAILGLLVLVSVAVAVWMTRRRSRGSARHA